MAIALLQSRLDRLRTSFAHAVTAVVDLDDDGQSMLDRDCGDVLDRRNVLTVITPDPDRPCIREARSKGARALTVDFARPETLAALPIWSRLDKLYLLSPRRLSESVAAAPHQRADGGGGRRCGSGFR